MVDRIAAVGAGSDDLPDHVQSAVRIRYPNRAFRIFAPLSVDDEQIVVRARVQIYRNSPNAVAARFHWDGPFLPFSEVAN